ncbi:conserved hypothetical protein [Theileria orientalis strain Shintoku]|uniref:Uncharacterized protein n=1 Tax=Theileria orientalis strain Shintoku TaxID=869250 RepID=J4C2L9_THEOR|nr:conserved hypothetical protein [Theileria orientalis strain Shintoku]BAM38921.1 conserved hypothetical protein [Theileria orientalis strain Shintoku]|eukprot:XP_009689222.1 conserved hypothetical protein [Theileria orientalis strain Shintoku]
MFVVILLSLLGRFYSNCISNKQYSFVKLPPIYTHCPNLSANLFEKEEIEAVNPCLPTIEKKPPIYNLEDPLSQFRVQNFIKTKDSPELDLSSLPYVQIEHQDKNKLVKFKDGREILSFYANKLNSYLANYMEWNKAYDPESDNREKLELYNPILPDTYYAVVYYCSWQSESIALVKAIQQLLGNYYFERDPKIEHPKKRKVRKKELLEEFRRIQAEIEEHDKKVEYAKENNLPIPPGPGNESIEPVKFNLRIPDVEETIRILDHCRKKYNFNWWMPKFGAIKYNRIVDKAFNELYNTSYKQVRSAEERKKYKLRDLKRVMRSKAKKVARPVNVNFVLVRLANSMMISNSRQGARRHRRFIQSHEKEFRFNEIMLRLLLDQEIYYENMPALQLFKCREGLDSLPSVYGSKSHAAKPLDEDASFYRSDPFEVAARVNYGLPVLRKCSHLAVADDFVHLGNFMDLGSLKALDAFESLFAPGSDALSVLTRTRDMSELDLSRLGPVLETLTLMYKFQLKKIVDARPKKPDCKILLTVCLSHSYTDIIP